MRTSIAAMALIRKEEGGQTLWLAQWNSRWRRFHLVGGHRESGESFRECVVREIEEELGLRDGAGVAVAAEPTAHVEFVAFSEGQREETAYTMELFDAELTTAAAREKVDAAEENRWLSESEIRLGLCKDGRPISPTLERLLAKIAG